MKIKRDSINNQSVVKGGYMVDPIKFYLSAQTCAEVQNGEVVPDAVNPLSASNDPSLLDPYSYSADGSYDPNAPVSLDIQDAALAGYNSGISSTTITNPNTNNNQSNSVDPNAPPSPMQLMSGS
jgi:hypothetical protein